MINFIIVEDNNYFLERFKNIVIDYMFKTNYSFDVRTFKEYNKEFFDIVNSRILNKIYLLDIHTNKINGIDIAKMIRKNDLNSTIIFLSAYEDDYCKEILRSNVQYFGFISKCEDFEKNLKLKLNLILKDFNKNNVIQFEENNILYTIPESNILYITKDKGSRKSKIVTDHNFIFCYKSIINFENELIRFSRTHRNCIVNPLRVISYDFKNKIIYFDNITSTNLLSKKYKNNIIKKIEQNKKSIKT